jgi:hypothetical protein
MDPADIDSSRDEFKNDLLKLASFIDVLSLVVEAVLRNTP